MSYSAHIVMSVADGDVIVRDPDTELVVAAMQTIIETIQVHHG